MDPSRPDVHAGGVCYSVGSTYGQKRRRLNIATSQSSSSDVSNTDLEDETGTQKAIAAWTLNKESSYVSSDVYLEVECFTPGDRARFIDNVVTADERDKCSSGVASDKLQLNETICFGIIMDLPLMPISKDSPFSEPSGPVYISYCSNSSELRVFDGERPLASMKGPGAQFLTSLHQENLIVLELKVYKGRKSTKPSSRPLDKNIFLSTVIYGPLHLFDDIGKFCQDYGHYLQDPHECLRNVRYRNPHRMDGLDDDAPMTAELGRQPEETITLPQPKSFLASLESGKSFPDATQPTALKTQLYQHQLKALGFMIGRESGWRLRQSENDMWSYRDSSAFGPPEYVNHVSKDVQSDPPNQFRGGMLADDMGLGKTITTIGLIASGILASFDSILAEQEVRETTLLIVPSSLVDQWDYQLSQHVFTEGKFSITWAKHHRTHKLCNQQEVRRFNIVLTSYETLTNEYRKSGVLLRDSGVLFGTEWHRVILDEAHKIRNRKTNGAKAVFELKASCRWVVTGTPIQNRLSDLSSLLQFLRVYPYSDHTAFKEDITDLWKSGDEELGFERLKRLFDYIAIRRLRSTIQLPERTDFVRHLEFSPTEREHYKEIEKPIIKMLDTALQNNESATGMFKNALAKLNSLRSFCNLGTMDTQSQVKNAGPSNAHSSIDERDADDRSGSLILEDLLSSGGAACNACGFEISPSPEGEEDNRLQLYWSDCSLFICGSCVDSRMSIEGDILCDQHPSCRYTALSQPIVEQPATRFEDTEISSKLLALRKYLQEHSTEKSVIFSSWTATLNVIQRMLDIAGIPYLRISGNVQARKRASILDQFRQDSSIQTMLISIGCGAEGLNLTCASRVYLMEPQWNPNVEEQALARVHRLGQTRPVTTIRFMMKDSIESHVASVQDRKKDLADLISGQDGKASNQHQRLQNLRDLLS